MRHPSERRDERAEFERDIQGVVHPGLVMQSQHRCQRRRIANEQAIPELPVHVGTTQKQNQQYSQPLQRGSRTDAGHHSQDERESEREPDCRGDPQGDVRNEPVNPRGNQIRADVIAQEVRGALQLDDRRPRVTGELLEQRPMFYPVPGIRSVRKSDDERHRERANCRRQPETPLGRQ